MKVQFFGSQIGGETLAALSYTGSPWQLFVRDIYLFFRWILVLPWIVFPIFPSPTNALNELYLSGPNVYCMFLHFILIISQTVFLLSLTCLLYFPFPLYMAYVLGFLVLNAVFCKLLNGNIPSEGLQSTKDAQTESWKKHEDESWIFLNGVSVGKHWLQSNIDRISRTFHRPVVGVHNKTSGIIFDVIQCLIQRCLLYATADVRECYVLVKEALYREGCTKVVLILHSQGAIEGSMIIDWLLNEVPQNKLQALEVYTFGNAANHFNNPYRDAISSAVASSNGPEIKKYNRAISHIEHYANNQDFVACWGVLSCTKTMPKDEFENRFMGRVFKRPGKGHLLNQHYLDYMFPLDNTGYRVRKTEIGEFMEMDCDFDHDNAKTSEREGAGQSLLATRGNGAFEDTDVDVLNDSPTAVRQNSGVWAATNQHIQRERTRLKVKDLSRLWAYRNGMSPPRRSSESN